MGLWGTGVVSKHILILGTLKVAVDFYFPSILVAV